MDASAIATPPESPGASAPRPNPLEDWSALVTELTEQHGLSQRQIAAHCRCGQPAISELARGLTNDPSHRIGEALRALRDAKRGEAAEKAATAARPVSGAGTGLVVAGRT